MKKKYLVPVLFLLFILSLQVPVFCAQDSIRTTSEPDYRILVPGGKIKNKLPVLKPLPPGDLRFAKAKYLFERTFIAQSISLYRQLQQYLVNSGEKKEVEPAYLLLSGRQGGFPILGFYLEEKGTISDKKQTWYIDMKDLDKDPASLSSMTQIFPHELGHVFFSLLAPEVRKNYQAYSSDMHYFSVTTNYLTAFNEGFAEHFENASRIYEPDKSIKAGIEKDTRRLSDRIPRKVNGLDRDFRFPLRLGYYRAGLLLWYQTYEDYKRYDWAMNRNVSFSNKTLSSGNSEKNILYRNTGLGFGDNQPRNVAQLASNEGVINAFFTHLLQSELKERYLSPAFYFPYFAGKDTIGFVPEQRLSPLQNYFLKLFTVLHRQMNHPPGDTSFLQLFVISWEREFPDEKYTVEKVYRNVTGSNFTHYSWPEIWLMNADHRHSFLVMDQYGGNTDPYYCMNLNTAEETDLLSFPGIGHEEVMNIILFRDKNNGFQSISDLNMIPGLSANTIRTLGNAHQLINKSSNEDEGEGLSINRIFIANGGHILFLGLVHFAIFWILFYLIFMRKVYSPGKILVISIQKFLKFYLLLVFGLACFMFSPAPVLAFLGVTLCILVVDWFKSGKKPVKRREVIITTLYMSAIVIYSLI